MSLVLRNLFSKPYRSVSAAQAAILADGGAILLDVSEPHEWQAGHAPGAASPAASPDAWPRRGRGA